MIAASIFAASIVATPIVGCSGPKRTIRIPDSVVANPKDKQAAKERAAVPYVVKMSDGQRTWQIEIPVAEGSPSFQAAIPLDLGQLAHQAVPTPPSEADKEIIEAKKARGEAVPATEGAEAQPMSYLAGTAKVRDLYARRQYELALIELVSLERQYPDDQKILEMKGTLFKKLGRPVEARQAWERVLALNPDNQAVARALEQLLEEAER